MNEPVSTATQQGVAVIRIDNPPVNALAAGVPDALLELSELADRDDDIRAIVVICAGRTFIAGADIHDLERAAWDETAPLPDFHPLLTAIEDCSKPVVMALHGTALGGGVEVAMAGHYRIAVADARLGLPEANLGIIPGAEGTQRLPRLVGIEKALEIVITGRPIGAADALGAGLVDRVVESGEAKSDLMQSAVAFALEIVESGATPPRTRDRHDRFGTPESIAASFCGRARAGPQDPAQSVGAACRHRRDCGGRQPAVRGGLRTGARTVAAVRAIGTVQGADPRRFSPSAACPACRTCRRRTAGGTIGRVAIIGAGTMGGGIAMACANAGLDVIVTDTTQAALDRGLSAIARNYEASVTRGRLTTGAVEERLGTHPRLYRLRRRRDGRSRHRGGLRESGRQAAGLRGARRGREGRRGDRHQHLDAGHRRDRRRNTPPGVGRRPAFFQSSQRHAARRDRARARRRGRRSWRPRSRWRSGWERSAWSSATVPASSGTA